MASTIKKERRRKSKQLMMNALNQTVTALAKLAEDMAKDVTITEENAPSSVHMDTARERTPAPSRVTPSTSVVNNNNNVPKSVERKSEGRPVVNGGAVTGTSMMGGAAVKSESGTKNRPTRDAIDQKIASKNHEDAVSDWVSAPGLADTQPSVSFDATQDLYSLDNTVQTSLVPVAKNSLVTAVHDSLVPVAPNSLVTAVQNSLVTAVQNPVGQENLEMKTAEAKVDVPQPPQQAPASVPQQPVLYYQVGRTFGSTIVKYKKCRLIKYQEKNRVGNYKLWCRKCHFMLLVKNYRPRQYGQKVEIIRMMGQSKCFR